MTRSSKYYRAPTRVRRPNHLPVIFNTARLRSASPRVRRLARTVLRVYVYCLLLLLAARSCVQVIGHTAEAVKTLATDPNQSNLSLASDQSPDECPLTEVIDDCLSCLFGKWAWHGPEDCDVDCPQVAVNASDGHLNTCLIEVPLQDTLQNQTGPVGPEETSGQCQLPLPVASYSTAFKTMLHGITFPIDFILWHTTLVTFNTFVHISLILYEFGPPLLTMNRETWRKLRKASSLSGKRGISCYRKTRVFLCVLSTHCLCMAVLKRFKRRALSKQIFTQLVRLPSLGLGRGVRCGQKIHGHSLTSFTLHKSFVKCIRFRPHCPSPMLLRRVADLSESLAKTVSSIRLPTLPNPAASLPSTFCHAFPRRAACIGKRLSQAVVKPYVFLRGLLLLAGDVERNPGPIQAEEVLMNYRNHFLSEIDANAVVYEFQHKGIVSDIVLQRICISYDPKQQNEILHAHLARTCTNEALMTACDIITSVKGNPRMSALGRDMQRRLESDLNISFTETDCSALYQNAIRNNPTITLHISKAMTIGPPQVGKTTVRRRLLGLPQPEVSSSTPVMERADTVSLCNVEGAGLSHRVAMRNEYESRTYMEKGDKWVMLNNATVIQSLLHHLQKKFGVTARSQKGSYSGEAPTQPSSALPVEYSPRSVTDVSRRIYKELWEPDKAEVDLPDAYLLQFLDCGGQLAYHDILPIFVNIPAIYLHVFNISKDLNERPKDELCLCRGEKKYSAESALTVADMIKRSVMTVHLLADKKVHHPSEVKDDNKYPKPRIVLVGTHLDELDEKDQNETLEAIGRTLRSALHLNSRSLEGMLMKDLDHDGMFFPVSYTPHEKCTADNLKNRIGYQARMDAVKVEVPVRWYLHLLLEMSQGEKPVYAYSELYQHCKGEGSITHPGEFHAMVTYFHALGLLIHLCGADVGHTEESACLVFTNPSYLYENISKIYQVQFEKEVEGEYKLQLKHEGKLTVEVLQELGVVLDPSKFMGLLVQLFIGAEIKPHEDKKEEREGKEGKGIEKGERKVKKTLFIPSVLVNSSLDLTGDAAIQKDPVSFSLTFKHTSFVPCGVFTGMIARLQSARKWNIDTSSISRTRMKFDVTGQLGTVCVLDCATHISVEIDCRKRLRTEQYQECRDTIITATADSFCFLFHSKADKDTQSGTCHACLVEPYLVLGQTCQLCRPQPGVTKAAHFAQLEVDNDIPVSVRCCKTRETKDLRDSELEQVVFTNITYDAVIKDQHTSHTLKGTETVKVAQCDTAEAILDLFREPFLKYVDAKAVVGELKQKGIVPQSCQEKVAKTDGYRQRNEILHDWLKRTCTREALIKACDIIIALAEEGGEESNPNMKIVGEDMKMKLGTEPTTPPPAYEDTPTLRHRHGPHHTTIPPPDIGHAHTDAPTSSSLYHSMLTLTVAIVFTLCLILVIMTLLYIVSCFQ